MLNIIIEPMKPLVTDQVMNLAERFFTEHFAHSPDKIGMLIMGRSKIAEFVTEHNMHIPSDLPQEPYVASSCLGKIETPHGTFYLYQAYHDNVITAMVLDVPMRIDKL